MDPPFAWKDPCQIGTEYAVDIFKRYGIDLRGNSSKPHVTLPSQERKAHHVNELVHALNERGVAIRFKENGSPEVMGDLPEGVCQLLAVYGILFKNGIGAFFDEGEHCWFPYEE